MVTFYSTNCPRCAVLEKKLREADIPFTSEHDCSSLPALGFDSAPVLDVDGRKMNFTEAIQWLRERGK